MTRVLKRARSAEHSCGKHGQPSQEAQHTTNRDTDQAKRKEENPDEGIQEQRQQSQRPADDQQNAPEQEFRHALYTLCRGIGCTGAPISKRFFGVIASGIDCVQMR